MKQALPFGMILFGLAFLGYGCGDRSSSTPASSEPTASTDTPEQVTQVARTEDSITPNAPEGTVPNELSESQEVLQRLPQVSAGRANPFGAILPGPIQVRPRTPAAGQGASPAIPAPPTILNPTAAATRARPQINSLPAAPTAPTTATAPAAPTTTATVPTAPTAPPPSLASQIRISGIVQIGNQLNVLVEVPNGGGSRPVRVGENIVGGVRLARVDVAANREPQIVLEEAGVETVKTVDSDV